MKAECNVRIYMILNHKQNQSAKKAAQMQRKSNQNLKFRACSNANFESGNSNIGPVSAGSQKAVVLIARFGEVTVSSASLCPFRSSMCRHFFLTLDFHLFVFFLSLFFWFSCAFSCSSEPAIRQTGTSIQESASLFEMENNLNFSISAKNTSHSDSIRIANTVSTFINPRSSKIVMLNETSSLNALDLNFLVRMSITGRSARKTLTEHLTRALGEGTKVLLTCNFKNCDSEQAIRLELSECTRIEWKFCCSSSPVLTVLSSEAQSNVTEQPQNPNGVGLAAPAAVFSCDGAAVEASLNLSGIESETSSMTAAGAHSTPVPSWWPRLTRLTCAFAGNVNPSINTVRGPNSTMPSAQAACHFSFADPAPVNRPATGVFVPSEKLSHAPAGNVKPDNRIHQSVFSPACMISFTIYPNQATAYYTFVPNETLRKNLIAQIRLKACEVAIDVFVTGPHNLQVRMACVWKTPMGSDAVRRLMNETIRKSGFQHINGSYVKYIPCNRTAVRDTYISHPKQGLRWLQFSDVGETMYHGPIEDLIQEVGKAVMQGEAALLMCSTREGYKKVALSNQALLFQLYDLLQSRYAAQVTPAAGTARLHPGTSAPLNSDTGSYAEALAGTPAEASCLTANATTDAVAETPLAASETITPSTIAAPGRVESAASPNPARRLFASRDTPGSATSGICKSPVPGSGESLGLPGIGLSCIAAVLPLHGC